MKNRNPVKRLMDSFHKPKTHRDRTKYHRQSQMDLTITDNLVELIKNQTMFYSECAKKAIEEAKTMDFDSYESRIDYISQRTDELLGNYPRYHDYD